MDPGNPGPAAIRFDPLPRDSSGNGGQSQGPIGAQHKEARYEAVAFGLGLWLASRPSGKASRSARAAAAFRVGRGVTARAPTSISVLGAGWPRLDCYGTPVFAIFCSSNGGQASTIGTKPCVIAAAVEQFLDDLAGGSRRGQPTDHQRLRLFSGTSNPGLAQGKSATYLEFPDGPSGDQTLRDGRTLYPESRNRISRFVHVFPDPAHPALR